MFLTRIVQFPSENPVAHLIAVEFKTAGFRHRRKTEVVEKPQNK